MKLNFEYKCMIKNNILHHIQMNVLNNICKMPSYIANFLYKIKNTKIVIYNVLQSVKCMISHNILYI